MELKIKDTINHEPYSIKIDKSDNVIDLKKLINSKFKVKLPLNQICLHFKNKNNKIPLSDNSIIISKLPSFSEECMIIVSNQGTQIDTMIANVIEYFLPIIIFISYIIYFKPGHLNLNQCITIGMSTFHYLKRVFESIFIHIHTKTMNLLMVVIECLYYGGLYGVCCGWFIFNNTNADVNYWRVIPLCMFIIAEVMNGHCHIILRKIRLNHSNIIKIPTGNIFGLVYCANYFWEFVSWLMFAVFTGLISCYVFALIGLIKMGIWATDRRNGYIAHFKEANKKTKAIIPFII